MKIYSISQLARACNLSRSTLLYYDRIGLLCPPERTAAGYRRYTNQQFDKLERICTLRSTGLSLDEIKALISSKTAPSAKILEHRLKEIDIQIVTLREQQHTIVDMLKEMTSGNYGRVVDKKMWVKMLAAAGMDEAAMMRWHADFESRAPTAHFEFLLSIGIPTEEAQLIQERSWKIAL
jgi:MerR family transcriptional regulator, thiopeptide resistance regulator